LRFGRIGGADPRLSLGELNRADDRFENLRGFLKGGPLLVIECGDLFCQRADSASASLHQEFLSDWGGGEEGAAAIACVLFFQDEALSFEGVDDSRHGGRADLLGGGEVAERDGACEDDDGEGGETGSIEAGALVLFAQLPQQVDGGGVKLAGDILRICEDFV
jgi:hypothetical protein